MLFIFILITHRHQWERKTTRCNWARGHGKGYLWHGNTRIAHTSSQKCNVWLRCRQTRLTTVLVPSSQSSQLQRQPTKHTHTKQMLLLYSKKGARKLLSNPTYSKPLLTHNGNKDRNMDSSISLTMTLKPRQLVRKTYTHRKVLCICFFRGRCGPKHSGAKSQMLCLNLPRKIQFSESLHMVSTLFTFHCVDKNGLSTTTFTVSNYFIKS